MAGETVNALRLCRHHLALLRRCPHPHAKLVTSFSSQRPGKSGGWIRKMFLGVAVGVPVVLGVQYALAEPRERRKIKILVEGVGRFSRSIYVGLYISVDYWWTSNVTLRGIDESSPSFVEEMSLCHQRAADNIVEGAVKNGGIYIKLGQGLCSFNHLLPPEYVKTLHVLEDKALNRRYKEVDALFQEDFNTTPDKMFKHFDHEPIAAGSLAQVHKAELQDGTSVAVKVGPG